MMEKVESFITRLRWKAHFFDEKEHSVNNTNFGFKSNFTPPQHLLLIFADKTTNLYEMTPEEYKTILTNNVTRTY